METRNGTSRAGRIQAAGVAAVFTLACAGGGAPADSASAGTADYGDAPDETRTGYPSGAKSGAFPTREASGGAHVLNPKSAWLGTAGDGDDEASNGSDPDTDDGVVEMNIELSSTGTRAGLVLEVGSEEPDARMWLNVLLDLDMNGRWEGPNEWVVQNHQVDFSQSDKKTQALQPPPFDYGDTPPPAAWMRIALTERTVPVAWDGTGSFERGEIEDYLVELPDSSQLVVGAICNNPETHSGAWGFDGREHVRVRCQLRPMGGAGGDVNFEFVRQSGGVTHAALCPGSSVNATSNAEHVRGGPVKVGKGPSQLDCLFNRSGRLPSEWELRIEGGASRSRVTETGIVVGVVGGSRAKFTIDKGSCDLECSGRSGCFGGKACRNGCCVDAWASECAELEPESCGRCCAITGGRSAGDCVRETCGI